MEAVAPLTRRSRSISEIAGFARPTPSTLGRSPAEQPCVTARLPPAARQPHDHRHGHGSVSGATGAVLRGKVGRWTASCSDVEVLRGVKPGSVWPRYSRQRLDALAHVEEDGHVKWRRLAGGRLEK